MRLPRRTADRPVSTRPHLVIRAVDAAVVRPLRSAVLRPGQPPEALVYEHDDHPLTLHAAAYLRGRIVSIATVHPQTPPEDLRGLIPEAAYAQGASFRLRGMATREEVRGEGAGRAVLERCFEHARQTGASFLWCNARTPAVAFYERMGMARVGETFDLQGIGPHCVMWREL